MKAPWWEASKGFSPITRPVPAGEPGRGAACAAAQASLCRCGRPVQAHGALAARPYDPAGPAIVLNLPEFRLRAFGGAHAAEHDPEVEMKVVVGQAPDHKTLVLRSQLETIIFRSYWTVPVSIQRNELLPEISRAPKWISDNNFELVTRQGEVVRGSNSFGAPAVGTEHRRTSAAPKTGA